ncbi:MULTISPECIES: hypothetical protein [Streptomyces]|uniref:Uncharacterized protein n=2 Tax=Streptomyces TaxID=1883 RepID=A0ABV9J0I0_9ACTN
MIELATAQIALQALVIAAVLNSSREQGSWAEPPFHMKPTTW